MEYGIFEVIATMDEKPKSPWQVMKNENKNVVLVKKFDESEEWSNIFNYFESHCDSFIEEYRMKYVCEISFLSKLHNEIEEGSIVNDDYYDDIVLITSIEPDSEEDRTYFEIEAENYAPDYSTGKYGLFEARASDKKGFESAYDVIEKDNWLSEPIDVFENKDDAIKELKDYVSSCSYEYNSTARLYKGTVYFVADIDDDGAIY